MATPIERLSALAAQNTARTDRLHEATCALLAMLEPHVEIGTTVTVDGRELRLQRLKSNVGYSDGWAFRLREYDLCVLLTQPVDREGYLHGDFNAPWRGPSRGHLIAFAERAALFVAALLALEEKTSTALEVAQSSVESAIVSFSEET
jgi:hypothetical protein